MCALYNPREAKALQKEIDKHVGFIKEHVDKLTQAKTRYFEAQRLCVLYVDQHKTVNKELDSEAEYARRLLNAACSASGKTLRALTRKTNKLNTMIDGAANEDEMIVLTRIFNGKVPSIFLEARAMLVDREVASSIQHAKKAVEQTETDEVGHEDEDSEVESNDGGEQLCSMSRKRKLLHINHEKEERRAMVLSGKDTDDFDLVQTSNMTAQNISPVQLSKLLKVADSASSLHETFTPKVRTKAIVDLTEEPLFESFKASSKPSANEPAFDHESGSNALNDAPKSAETMTKESFWDTEKELKTFGSLETLLTKHNENAGSVPEQHDKIVQALKDVQCNWDGKSPELALNLPIARLRGHLERARECAEQLTQIYTKILELTQRETK